MRNRLLAALFCGFAPLAYAAHPLVTDDPYTQGDGGQQVEANTDWATQDDTHKHIGSFTYTYGVADNLDVFINVPMTFTTPSGINDLSLGAKWRILDTNGFSAAIKPELLLPTGDETKMLGTGRENGKLTGIVAYDAQPWRVFGNLGISINRYKLQADQDANRSVTWSASASVWYSLNEQWKLLGDIGIARNIEKASNSYPGFLIAGAMYSPTPNLDLDVGVRFGQQCSTCSVQANRQVGVGLAARF